MAHHGGGDVPMQVRTNAFLISRGPKSKEPWFQYHVIDTQLDRFPTRRAFEIIDKLQRVFPQYFTPRAVFDGKAGLFSKRGDIPAGQLEVRMSANPTSSKGVFKVNLTRVRQIKPDWIEELLVRGAGEAPNTDTSTTTLLQIVVRQGANMRHHYPPNARAFFVEHGTRDMNGGLRAYRGFYQSVRPAIGRLLLNVDTVTALLYRPGPLLDVALSYLGKRNPRDLANLPTTEFNRLRAFLKGVRVTIQTARSDRARPISNLVTNAGAYEFEKDGSPTTVQEYYRQVYNVQLRYPSIFGIRIGRDAVFPIELCNIEKGQLYRKKIPAEIGPDFLSFSTQKPHDRLQTIEAAISGPNQLFNYDVSDFMQEAGLQIDHTPLLVQGRVMPTPAIQYRGSSLNLQDKSGAWNVVRKQFLSPKPIEAWAVVNFDPRASGDNRARFLSKLSENLQALGVQIRLPPVIDAGNPNQVADSIERVARRAHPEGKAPTIVIAFLPSSGAEIRREIKHWGDIRRYVPTQCVRAGKWERVSDQYCNNVALKINAKIGGINSKIIPTLSGLKALVPPRTMVIGADIGHPGPGVSNRPSMTSLVTSLNDDCTQYAAFSAIQEPRVEIIANLQAMLKDAIYQYLWHNDGQYPQRIVFFRDGVSEGEYARVARDEIESINSCLVNLVGFQKNGEPVKDGTKVYAPGKKPPVTFIVVGKRHHIRFFPTSRENADRSGNCPPGFVVDNEITGTAFPNYYLQSHSGIQGTSRPSHYIILRNEIGLPVETCQRLSFDLCHVYASATRSVSIPAPVYYADRVCARADFHYRPDLRFGDTDSGIGTDSSVFDLQKWEDGFKPAGLPALRKMYFL